MKTARVILDKATYAYDREYDYQLPDTLSVSAGCRVTVPFGAGNSTRIALVIELIDTEPPKKCKQIISVLDEQPLLNEEGLYLLRVLKSTGAKIIFATTTPVSDEKYKLKCRCRPPTETSISAAITRPSSKPLKANRSSLTTCTR